MMGFLAPLYAAGLLAIGLPILFHLIRRTPKGTQQFSSLMFLSPSPPSVTRRSRLSNIFLLLLRALALVALALAFSRPFFNQGPVPGHDTGAGRRVAIMVDTSASMRRGALWDAAKKQVADVVREVRPTDQVALYFFDKRARPALTFDEWNSTDISRRGATLEARLAAETPSWLATRLGDSLIAVADELAEKEAGAKEADRLARQIVLVSDLQQGGHPETLQGHQWPAGVTLDVRKVAEEAVSNAGVQWIQQAPEDASRAAPRLGIKVVNAEGSSKEQFTVAWGNSRGPLAGVAPASVYVAPGKSQVVRLTWPSDASVDRVVLSGDDVPFDNTLYVVPPATDTLRLLYLGDDAADDVEGVQYYLQSALASTPRRQVEIVQRRKDEPVTNADRAQNRLWVVAGTPSSAAVDSLRRELEAATPDAGGPPTVLWVAFDTASAEAAAKFAGVTATASEAGGEFALLGRINFAHPLFAPLADARFSDFTRIRFWKHRKVAWPVESEVLARFENGDPFLIEKKVGTGRLLLMTSSWRPVDSQLALSTKFVPLMENIARQPGAVTVESQVEVGQALPASGGAAPTTMPQADKPGIVTLPVGGRSVRVAVNLAADETRTAPLPVESLERWGVVLTKPSAAAATSPDAKENERRLQAAELENRQKVWQWLIVGVLGLLVVETAVAGRLAHRPQKEQATS